VIPRRSPKQIEAVRKAGKLVAEALSIAGRLIKPGVTTRSLDEEVAGFIRGKGAKALFLGYRGFPAHICASVNEEVVHGIPGKRVLCEGDIVAVDVGIGVAGWCADAAATFPVGDISAEAARLLEVTRLSLDAGIGKVCPGNRLEEVCAAVQRYVEERGYQVVRKYAGHGIGRRMHEEPHIPNYVSCELARQAIVLQTGMVLAVEPMVNRGTYETVTLSDGWTVVTADGSLSAHFEHTVAVTDAGPDVLTT